jgi:hypothetical protein
MTVTTLTVTTLVGISILPLSTLAIEFLIRTACLHPTLGEGECEIGFSKSTNTDLIWDVTWQDGTETRFRILRHPSLTQRWNSQNNRWLATSSTGFCFDRRCIHFPAALFNSSEHPFNSLEQQTSRITIECLDPTLGEGTCQAEYVPDTDGLRVYWSDGSIEHYRFKDKTYLKWSHVENGWIEPSNQGICFDRFCILFDSDTFNQQSNN